MADVSTFQKNLPHPWAAHLFCRKIVGVQLIEVSQKQETFAAVKMRRAGGGWGAAGT